MKHTELRWEKLTPDKCQVSLDEVRKKCLTAMSQIDTLSNYKWHFFRKLLNEHDFESREVAVNRAFYKLWEILSRFPPSCPSTTLHLAEAPGSFVQVIKKKFPRSQSVAISKPPSSYADVVKKGKTIPVFDDAVFKLKNCEFYYTDLLKPVNVAYYTNIFRKHPFYRIGFDLITADGGFDEEERYDAKETLHYNLILGEIVFILLNQKKGGMCILKIFESFTDTTIHLLWLLCSTYENFDIVKPSTSRPTNAERYIVCRGFRGNPYPGQNLQDLMRHDIKKGDVLNIGVEPMFVEKMCRLSQVFAEKQIDAINAVMNFVHEKCNGRNGSIYIDKRQYSQQKKRSFQEWKTKYCYDDNQENIIT